MPANTQKQTYGTNRSQSINSHRSSSRKKIKQLKVINGILIGLIVVIMIFMILNAAKSTHRASINNQLSIKLNKQENILEQANQKIATMEEDLKTLVTGRIPNLRPLEFDESITIDHEYLHNIIFTLTGIGKNKSYEYRVVVKNDALNAVQPSVKIFLFDELGIQAGITTLSKEDATSEVEFEALQPGETRAFSSVIPLARDADPKYFLITLK